MVNKINKSEVLCTQKTCSTDVVPTKKVSEMLCTVETCSTDIIPWSRTDNIVKRSTWEIFAVALQEGGKSITHLFETISWTLGFDKWKEFNAKKIELGMEINELYNDLKNATNKKDIEQRIDSKEHERRMMEKFWEKREDAHLTRLRQQQN